jgi:hypothetical protein
VGRKACDAPVEALVATLASVGVLETIKMRAGDRQAMNRRVTKIGFQWLEEELALAQRGARLCVFGSYVAAIPRLMRCTVLVPILSTLATLSMPVPLRSSR